MAPVPLEPFVPDQVADVAPAGSGSLTDTLVAVDGPLLETTIVYVVEVPGTAVVTPSVFVTATFVCGVSESVSVALLFLIIVSSPTPALAAFPRLPRAPAPICTTSV